MEEEEFFKLPKAAQIARLLVFLHEHGHASQREWDYQSARSPRHSIEIRDQMEELGFIVVTRKPLIDITLTKESEELARTLAHISPAFKRFRARTNADKK